MKVENIIYKSSKFGCHETLYLSGGALHHVKNTFGNKKSTSSPINQIKNSIEFDQKYHMWFIGILLYFLIQSCRLLIKFMDGDDWRKYLGLVVFVVSSILLLYYILKGRHTGTTIIKLQNSTIELQTSLKEYKIIRDSLN